MLKLFDIIEAIPNIKQKGWDDNCAIPENYQAFISQANKAINLTDFLLSKTILQYLNSATGWTHKTNCPFHKDGHERTASFFINSEQNRFYCQACGVAGGICEYIALMHGRPTIIVAEHIIECINGKFVIDTQTAKAINDRKKFQEGMLNLSILYRNFVRRHICDEKAIIYINNCMSAFDSIIERNQETIEDKIEDILNQFKLYLEKYK